MSDTLKQGRRGALPPSGCLERRGGATEKAIAGRAGAQMLSNPGLPAVAAGGAACSVAVSAAGMAAAGKQSIGAAVQTAGGSAAAAPKAQDKGHFSDPPHDCALCPRLRNFLQEWRQRQPGWHNAPVRPFLPPGGLAAVQLLLVGLAPGLQGANRTGRPFTGDGCGALLYSTLAKYGFARGSYQARPDDGLQLTDMAIVNAVRCVPPENRPLGAEIKACRRYLAPYLHDLPRLHVVVTLGKVAHESTLRALGVPLKAAPFIHGRIADIDCGAVAAARSSENRAQHEARGIQAEQNGNSASVEGQSSDKACKAAGKSYEGSFAGRDSGLCGRSAAESSNCRAEAGISGAAAGGSKGSLAGRGDQGGDNKSAPARRLRLISSYHCSRYNTSTGRLTEAMFHEIFAAARACLQSA